MMARQDNRILWFFMKLFWIGFALTVVVISIWSFQAGSARMLASITAARPYLAVWRLALFLALIGGWPIWIDWLARRFQLDSRQFQALLAWRWRMAAWLIIIEVLLVQGVYGRFLIAIGVLP